MTLPDEKVMAYVDGELDAAGRAEVEAAMKTDERLARRIEEQQVLRRRLTSAFEEVLREPVPERLVAAARTTPVATTVASLASAREERSRAASSGPRASVWLAMAASLVVGLFLGIALFRSPVSPLGVSGGQLVAQGALADALTSQLAIDQSTGAPVQVGLSFRDRGGEFCRTFVLHDGAAVGGVACRQGERWAVQAVARYPGENSAGDYRPAAGELPPAVLAVVEERIQGEPLDAQGEAAAKDRGWRRN